MNTKPSDLAEHVDRLQAARFVGKILTGKSWRAILHGGFEHYEVGAEL